LLRVPFERLVLRVPGGAGHPVARVESASGEAVTVRREGETIIVELPPDVADIVLLPWR